MACFRLWRFWRTWLFSPYTAAKKQKTTKQQKNWSAAKRILVCVLAPAILCVIGYFYQGMDIPGADRLWVQVVRNLFIVLAKSVSGFWIIMRGYLLYRRGKKQPPQRIPVLAVLLAVTRGLALLSPDLDFNSFKLGSFAPVFYLNGVLGSVAVLELLRWLEARISLRPLIWGGRHAMFLMATQLPWQIAPELVMLGKRFYLAQTPTAPYFLMMLAEFAVLMLIEAALVWYKEKVKAAMTGRWGKERPICKAVKYL